MPQTAEDRRQQSREAMRKLRAARREQGMGIVTAPSGMPRPRETRVITALAQGKPVSVALRDAGYHPQSTAMRNRLKPGGDLREAWANALIAANVTKERVAEVISSTLEAKRVTYAPEAPGGCIEAPDHTARLGAAKLAREALQDAGELPVNQAADAGGSQITVNILSFSAQGQSGDNLPALPQAIDSTVVDGVVDDGT